MGVHAEYVLGTSDQEIERLCLQHVVWRSDATRAWRDAGFCPGNVIIDVGCGPGFATLDLSELVGPNGLVHAIDQSARFLGYLEAQAAARRLENVITTAADLTTFGFDGIVADGAWMRWVLAFVPEPRAILQRLANALRPGARVAIHEYFAYQTWAVVPADEEFGRFVAAVMQSWRRRGGEPNVGMEVPSWLEELGFSIRSTRTITDLVRADDPRWQWPATFALSGVDRLIELGDLQPIEGASVRRRVRELVAAQRWMITPAVLETIAEWPRSHEQFATRFAGDVDRLTQRRE